MKAIVKRMYEEIIENIEFPTMVYVYETGRILGINKWGKELIGSKKSNLNKMWNNNMKLKITKKNLENGSKIFFNQEIIVNPGEVITIDIEVNSIIIDDVHICICFFEKSYKQCFVKYLTCQLPRIFWKDKKLRYLGVNKVCRADVLNMLIPNSGMKNEDFLHEETYTIENELDLKIMIEQFHYYNKLQFFRSDYNPGSFAKVNKIPLINKNGTVIGILCIYMQILSREEYKKLCDYTMKENNILSNMICKSDNIIISCSKNVHYQFDYVTPNIVKYGYSVDQFYNQEIHFETIIYQEDLKRMNQTLQQLESGKINEAIIKVRAYNAKKQLVPIKMYIEVNGRSDGRYSFECMIRDSDTTNLDQFMVI